MLETSYLSVSQRERSNAFVLQNRNAHKNYSLEINLILFFAKIYSVSLIHFLQALFTCERGNVN